MDDYGTDEFLSPAPILPCLQLAHGDHGHNTVPVSYTHLDVYKRQMLYSIYRHKSPRNKGTHFIKYFCF